MKFLQGVGAFLCLMLMTGMVQADDSWFSNIDYTFSGELRADFAYSMSDDENPANQNGNRFNGRAIPRQAYLPPNSSAVLLGPATGGLVQPGQVGSWTTLPFPAAPLLLTDVQSAGIRGVDTSTGQGAPIRTADSKYNYAVLRADLVGSLKFNQHLQLLARMRAVFDPAIYNEFDASRLTRGGITGGDAPLYGGKPNYLEYRVEGDSSPNPLEWSGDNYLIYFPSLFLQYQSGALTVRAGNQQIAWGQALFFRVFDVVNGLDLRRHLILDYAQEEYADERVPALAVRANYQINSAYLVDGFVEKFQPSILPNPNTPYNLIPTQFTVHDLYHTGGYDEKLNYGMRLRANFGQWGFQVMATQRYNPAGTYRWTQSGVNKDLTHASGSFGQFVHTSLSLVGKDSGEVLSRTPFEASCGGVSSANEWFDYAAQVRLDGLAGLNASIDEFEASREIYGSHVNTMEEATNELNTFFIASGCGLRGHIAREYHKEEVYAVGGSYVTEGEGWLDQLIINLEVSYTPNRTFTSTSLSRDFIKDDAIASALVMEKYYRFSPEFPATYFVFQWMWRNVDDLFGRHLSGYGGSETSLPNGKDNANYFVFAFQQPWPQDIVRAGFALLYDPEGSILVQPGIRWKINNAFTLEGFYTYIDGALGSVNPNSTLLSTIDYADELTVRFTYQF